MLRRSDVEWRIQMGGSPPLHPSRVRCCIGGMCWPWLMEGGGIVEG